MDLLVVAVRQQNGDRHDVVENDGRGQRDGGDRFEAGTHAAHGVQNNGQADKCVVRAGGALNKSAQRFAFDAQQACDEIGHPDREQRGQNQQQGDPRNLIGAEAGVGDFIDQQRGQRDPIGQAVDVARQIRREERGAGQPLSEGDQQKNRHQTVKHIHEGNSRESASQKATPKQNLAGQASVEVSGIASGFSSCRCSASRSSILSPVRCVSVLIIAISTRIITAILGSITTI